MTLLACSGWRLLQNSPGKVSSLVVWPAIVVSAVIFGAGRLPSSRFLIGHLIASAIARVTVGGAVFGIVAGSLYWHYGLEAAILFHASAHVFAYMACKVNFTSK